VFLTSGQDCNSGMQKRIHFRTDMEHNICRPVNNSHVSLGYQFCWNITFILYIIYNVRYNNIIYPSSSKCWLIDEVYIGDRRGRDRTVVEFTIELPVKSMQVITKVVSSNHIDGKVYSIQHYMRKFVWLATGRGFPPGTPVSSTNKTDRHDITEILLKVVLNTISLT
jgi:hypothetical protein